MIARLFDGKTSVALGEFEKLGKDLKADADAFAKATAVEVKAWSQAKRDNNALNASSKSIAERGDAGHNLAKEIDHITKLFSSA